MNLEAIDLNLLLVFEALMDERQVTRAAKRIGLSQPAMSNALTRLRRTFNDQLFIKTSTGMIPTPTAQTLSEPVHLALSKLREALDSKRAFNHTESRRTFHILANDYIEITLLMRLLQTLRARARGIKLRLHRPRNLFEPPTASELTESFDLAISLSPNPLVLDSSARSELLWEEGNVCIARKTHPLIQNKLSIKQYAEADHIAVFYKQQGQGVIDTLLAQKGLSRRTVVHVPHFTTVPFAVSETDLIATIPESLAKKFSKQLKLQVLPLPIAIPPFRLTLLWHERFHNDPAHQWMRNLLIEHCR
ncbi:MAG: LysR family transcriptional regulator [Acidobacteriota bacterium]